jgi:hypothetical protein
MIVAFTTEGLKQVRWHEYLIRFVLGGLVTVVAGVLAELYGFSFGGLFLAFPAILVASATLLAKHERKRKQAKGLHGRKRGRLAAGADSAGAAVGSLGLMAFGAFVWKLLPEHSAWVVLSGAVLIWSLVAGTSWWIRWRVLPRLLRTQLATRLRGRT